jgi:plastocyanin
MILMKSIDNFFQRSLQKAAKFVFAVSVSFVLLNSLASAQGVVLRLHNNDGEPVVDAVMELLSDSVSNSTSTAVQEVEIDQRDKEFIPSITTVVAGGSASFPNSDDILHHVYSFSPAKTFDTPLYGSEVDRQYREVFDVPGVIEIGCNIHDWMLAYIYVGQSPLMAISDEQGFVSLTGMAPGSYTLRVWHSRLDEPQNYMEQEIVIEAGRTTELEMTVELTRDRRVRRAPSANRKRYR